MLSIMDHIGPELPFTLLLLALLGLRARVTPRTSLWINVTPEKLWNLLRVYDGKIEDWGGFTIRSELIDPATKTYRKTFSVLSGTGTTRQSQALFRISAEEEQKNLELTRADLQDRSENNELLKLRDELHPEGRGTRLKTTYYWAAHIAGPASGQNRFMGWRLSHEGSCRNRKDRWSCLCRLVSRCRPTHRLDIGCSL